MKDEKKGGRTAKLVVYSFDNSDDSIQGLSILQDGSLLLVVLSGRFAAKLAQISRKLSARLDRLRSLSRVTIRLVKVHKRVNCAFFISISLRELDSLECSLDGLARKLGRSVRFEKTMFSGSSAVYFAMKMRRKDVRHTVETE